MPYAIILHSSRLPKWSSGKVIVTAQLPQWGNATVGPAILSFRNTSHTIPLVSWQRLTIELELAAALGHGTLPALDMEAETTVKAVSIRGSHVCLPLWVTEGAGSPCPA